MFMDESIISMEIILLFGIEGVVMDLVVDRSLK